MLAFALLCQARALAHGGEDHGPPPPPLSAARDDTRVATWSTEYEAVLRLPYAAPGEPVEAALLLADFRTSAPVAAGQAQLTLSGPADLALAIEPGETPGVWPFSVTFPVDGSYSGGLAVISERADMLGIPTFTRARPPSPARSPAYTLALSVLASAIASGTLGFLLGRSRARAAALAVTSAAVALLALSLRHDRASAHGGEDHAPPSAPTRSHSSGSELSLPLENQFLLGIRTTLARRGPFEERVRTFGVTVTRPGGGAELHAPVTGILSLPEQGVVPGQIVRAGDPLAFIAETLGGAERSDVITGRTEALIGLAQAKKQLALAERDAERASSLDSLLSERERIERRQALDVAREAVAQAEAAASSLRSRAPTTALRAPLSGRISAMLARPGDIVTPGDVLFRIVSDGGLWVEARAPETLGGRLEIGAPALLIADARPEAPLPATVLDPGSEVDPDTGTLKVTLVVDEVTDWLKPGMAVTANIVSGQPRETLSIPDSAIIDTSGEPIVFLKTGPESFEARSVRLGALSAERREVLGGLEGGERVVTDGTYVLRSLAGR